MIQKMLFHENIPASNRISYGIVSPTASAHMTQSVTTTIIPKNGVRRQVVPRR